jgi:hypothetical protein
MKVNRTPTIAHLYEGDPSFRHSWVLLTGHGAITLVAWDGPRGLLSRTGRTLPKHPEFGELYPVDLGFHSCHRQDPEMRCDPCEYLEGAPCWYYGSTLGAEDVFRDWAAHDWSAERLAGRLAEEVGKLIQ